MKLSDLILTPKERLQAYRDWNNHLMGEMSQTDAINLAQTKKAIEQVVAMFDEVDTRDNSDPHEGLRETVREYQRVIEVLRTMAK